MRGSRALPEMLGTAPNHSDLPGFDDDFQSASHPSRKDREVSLSSLVSLGGRRLNNLASTAGTNVVLLLYDEIVESEPEASCEM
jgi:hypothetical protein